MILNTQKLQKKILKVQKSVAKANDERNIRNCFRKKGFVFVHIPKNAGTSITKAIGIRRTTHHTAVEFKRILGDEYYSLFKFCFVRNPWDRFLSLYNYAKLDESYYHSAINPQNSLYGKHLDYDLLKQSSLADCARYLVEGKLKHDRGWNHWLPQTNWILDENHNVIVDYIGRFEELDYHFEEISNKIGLQQNLNFENASSPKSEASKRYRCFYDEESRNIVESYYAKDIEAFGYEF